MITIGVGRPKAPGPRAEYWIATPEPNRIAPSPPTPEKECAHKRRQSTVYIVVNASTIHSRQHLPTCRTWAKEGIDGYIMITKALVFDCRGRASSVISCS